MEDNVTYATVVIKEGKQPPKGKKVWPLLTLVFYLNQAIEFLREGHCSVTAFSLSGIQACLHKINREISLDKLFIFFCIFYWKSDCICFISKVHSIFQQQYPKRFKQLPVWYFWRWKQSILLFFNEFRGNSPSLFCECWLAEKTEEPSIYASVKTNQDATTSSECLFKMNWRLSF